MFYRFRLSQEWTFERGGCRESKRREPSGTVTLSPLSQVICGSLSVLFRIITTFLGQDECIVFQDTTLLALTTLKYIFSSLITGPFPPFIGLLSCQKQHLTASRHHFPLVLGLSKATCSRQVFKHFPLPVVPKITFIVH